MLTPALDLQMQAPLPAAPAANDVCALPDKVLPFALMHPRFVTIERALFVA